MAQTELLTETKNAAVLDGETARDDSALLEMAPLAPTLTPGPATDIADGAVVRGTCPTVLQSDPALLAQRLRLLNEIGLALSAERNISRLLKTILSKSRELTDADAGTLYLIDKQQGEDGAVERRLFFQDAENDSVPIATSRKFAVSSSSLAGYVALTGETLCFGDVYDLPTDAPYQFNPAFDRENGYRTRSVLVVPLRNRENEVIGVLQLINRKRRRDALLTDVAAVDAEVIPFDGELTDLASSLASQAAVALENSMQQEQILRLLHNIEELFESFVKASSAAIEDRDPTTSGHSQRVTILTVGMAQAATRATDGPFRDISFSPQQIKELQYAGLLHDFGKIGVRENILTKSHKVDLPQFEAVKSRLLLRRRERALEHAQRKLELLQSKASAAAEMTRWDAEIEAELQQLDEHLQTLDRINDPSATFIPNDEFERQQAIIQALAALTYTGPDGTPQPLLNAEEIKALSVRRGTLTEEEYRAIQRHAELSYEFLKQIRWTDEYKQLPHIAHAHHEKLNGKGYPQRLTADEIPLPVRMMTVADIYDALTAADRPYKKAMQTERAIAILREEARDGGLDPDVVELFISQQIYKLTEGWKPRTVLADK